MTRAKDMQELITRLDAIAARLKAQLIAEDREDEWRKREVFYLGGRELLLRELDKATGNRTKQAKGS